MSRPWSRRQQREFPELAHFPPDDRLIRRWVRAGSLGWFAQSIAGWIACIAWLMIAGRVFALIAKSPLIPRSQAWMWVTFAIVALLAILLGGVIAHGFGAFWVFRIRQRRLRAELRRRGIPICIACGYEGGTIDISRCPECGAVHEPA